VEEGDVILFPSSAIHRAPVVLNDTRKTIVSWNLFLLDPNKKVSRGYL
jgi:predicted 2-oxoglutarate/Fe(II)-dependent dioxygenase YbiX